MRRILIILILVLPLSGMLRASHIIGGNFDVVQTGRNEFFIDLIIFRDCRTSGNPPPVQLANTLWVRVYDRGDNANYFDLIVNKPTPDKPQLGDDCYEPPNLCVEEYHLADTLSLPDNPNGYIISMQICCRNYIIDNIANPGATGMTVTAEIPDPALAGGNSTPQLGSYPDNGFLCLFGTRTLDLSAVDPDGDSLYYQLTRPYNSPMANTGQAPPGQPPYGFVNWLPGYSESNPIPGSPGMSINPQTGLLSVTPIELGLFVFAYEVQEYRNGNLIGRTRRDLQLEVLACVINEPPVFELPTETTFQSEAGEETCFLVRVSDPNEEDTIQLTTSYSYTRPSEDFPEDIRVINRIGTGSVGGQACWTPTCEDAFNGRGLKFIFEAMSYGCDRSDTITREVVVNPDPMPDDILSLLPNIFSPNGDGVNDVYKLQSELPYPCISGLELRIFNRWGVEVYHNELNNQFGWDGKFKGRDAAAGVYFFVVSGKYGVAPFEKNSSLTLVR